MKTDELIYELIFSELKDFKIIVSDYIEDIYTYDDFMVNYSSTNPTGGHFPGIAVAYLSDQATWGTGPTDKLNGDSSNL